MPTVTEETGSSAGESEDIILQTDISSWLVLKEPTKDGPDVRGGQPDALIVLATKATKGRLLFYFINALFTIKLGYFVMSKLIFQSYLPLKIIYD